jgi:hypothetical protein
LDASLELNQSEQSRVSFPVQYMSEAVLDRGRRPGICVIDTPPLTAVSDAFPLLGKVDGVVIVGRVGRNRRDVAQRLHETLAGAGAPLLGVIANGLNTRRGSYGGYGYTYDYTQAKPEPPSGASALASSNGASASEPPVPSAKT